MKHVIFVDENIPLLAEALRHCGVVTKYSGRKLSRHELIDSHCTALFIRSATKINSALIEGTSVKFIGTATSGIDHIDVEFLKKNNITFAYAPGSNANSVAEYVVYSILKWKNLIQSDIGNKLIGIVGHGNIGKIVAKYSNYMGLKILVNDPLLKNEGFKFPDYVEYAQLNELCEKADIITNHVPLTNDGIYRTHYLFNEQNIRLIKSGTLFIHTSRGAVVDEKSLLSKLDKDFIYTAIDVWENEPNINHELLNKTIIATPHIAGYSRDGKIRGTKMMADAFKEYSGLEPDITDINHELSLYNPLSIETFSDYDKLYSLLQYSREIDEDTKNLKEILNDNNSKVDVFDLLRKTYPLRREIL